MKYLNEVDGLAKEIGAVNTIVNRAGKLIGYNTDYFGLDYSLNHYGINIKDKKVFVPFYLLHHFQESNFFIFNIYSIVI
ncbi:hypothetical protein [Peptoniphilus porci]|uniref:hypothetical protein n=1 Tax=Peptoniphilus porci TaxID=2652280 RepID=UPI000B06A2DA|nr:hypothetical protein [Peptoniphilus porci]